MASHSNERYGARERIGRRFLDQISLFYLPLIRLVSLCFGPSRLVLRRAAKLLRPESVSVSLSLSLALFDCLMMKSSSPSAAVVICRRSLPVRAVNFCLPLPGRKCVYPHRWHAAGSKAPSAATRQRPRLPADCSHKLVATPLMVVVGQAARRFVCPR